MALNSGTKLGPYEIIAPLGAGGMGEVYRARDTRLERDVAIKVLPANVSSDSNLRQRLEREAKAVSKLSHSHICTLHDIGHQDGVDFLVMELVEGETLEHKLTRGPLPPEQTARLAAQIADALAKAHKQGITHRDLKPANIMLTKSGAKLMDFGLAKLESDPAPLAEALTEMTAERSKLTGEGTIVGTLQYMAPEQLEGKEADPRTDIFALGEVIFETATGKPAFSGRSRASLIAAILTNDPPPIGALQPMTPPALERLVKKCLAKDPDDRWQNASDLASELRWIADYALQTGVAPPTAERSNSFRKITWILATVCVVLLTLAAWLALRSGREQLTKPLMLFGLALPPDVRIYSDDGGPALSPDGRYVAFVAKYKDGPIRIWIRALNALEATPLPGTEGGTYPFWSPGGNSLGFFALGKLKRFDLTGNSVRVLCDASDGRGGAWNQDGVILFAPQPDSPLFRVSENGGTPEQVTQLGEGKSHRWPSFLPDGKHFLYTSQPGSTESSAGVFLASLYAPHGVRVLSEAINAFVAGDYLIYARNGLLLASGFNLKQGKTEGDGIVLGDQVEAITDRNYAAFSISQTGVLAFTPGGQRNHQLVWFNRSGKELNRLEPNESFAEFELTADGKRLVTNRKDESNQTSLWIFDLQRGTLSKISKPNEDSSSGLWAPDAASVAYLASRSGQWQIIRKWIDGSEREELLVSSPLSKYPDDWSKDGKWLVFESVSPTTKFDLYAVPVEGDHKPQPYLVTLSNEAHARISPDGHWLAYVSDESGQPEVYVQSFPATGKGKWQISTQGGDQPAWSGNGRELFFLSPEQKLMSVDIKPGAVPEPGIPTVLFGISTVSTGITGARNVYVSSHDGQRFLVDSVAQETTTTGVVMQVNWVTGVTNQNARAR
jgi:serine/threonine protein kinase/Tol biopolymer transport system component